MGSVRIRLSFNNISLVVCTYLPTVCTKCTYSVHYSVHAKCKNHGPSESVFGAIAARINGVAPPFVTKLIFTSYVDNIF